LEKKLNVYEGCERELEITVSNEELEPYLEKEYIKIQPQIELKGFRKGKVPIRIIKQFFGKKIENEVFEEVSNELFNKIIQEDKIRVVGQPQLKDVQRTSDGATFQIVFEVIPDFELMDYRSLQIDEPVHTVKDEEIEEQVNKLCINEGKFEDDEIIEDEHYLVQLKLYELDENSETILLDKEPQETYVLISDKTVVPELREKLIGCRVDDRFNFHPHNHDHSIPDKKYSVVIMKIQKVIPAEFSNEFVEKITKGKFLTTEEFRQEIGFDIQEQWNQKSRQEMENQIVEQLVEAHHFEIPETLIWNTIEGMVADYKKRLGNTSYVSAITVENMAESLRPMARNTVSWEIIKQRIIEKEKLEVEDHDIEDIIEAQAQKTGADHAVVRREVLKNKNITFSLLNKKVIDLIMDFATTNEITFEEYEHKHHHDHNHDHDFEDEVDENESKSNIILP
jgi:trigger factor